MGRIALITANLSPNFGIGDYVRLLAVEFVRLGHSVQIHALNYAYSSTYTSEVISVDGKEIQVHCWGDGLSSALKCGQSRKLLEAFKPDWVSLQFEFYCFSKKGLMGGFSWHLPRLLRNYRVHLMMHELWGKYESDDLRERLKGFVRYLQCRHLIKKIRPLSSHTSVRPYARDLEHLLPDIKLLSVPSNILVDREAPLSLPQEISGTMSGERSHYLLVILFGRIIEEWKPDEVLRRIDEFSKRTSRQVRLISVGEIGYKDLYWNRLVDQMPSDWRSIKLGWRDSKFISNTLQCCDLAVSTTPFLLSRKSGTTAAFLEHNLPVLFAEGKFAQEEIEDIYPSHFHKQFHFSDAPLELETYNPNRLLNAESCVSMMARQLYSDLSSLGGDRTCMFELSRLDLAGK